MESRFGNPLSNAPRIRLAVAVAVAAAFVISWGLFHQSTQPEAQAGLAPATSPSAARNVSEENKTKTPDAATSTPVVSLPVPPALPSSREMEVLADLRASFERARNLTAFIHAALARGDSAGRLYAQVAMEHCGRVTVIQRDDANQPERSDPAHAAAARERLQDEVNRCRDFAATHPDLRTRLELLADPALSAPAHPLFEMRTANRRLPPESRTLQELLPDLAWALAIEDPNLFEVGLHRISSHLAPARADRPEAETRALMAAWSTVACDLAPSCRTLALTQACLELKQACSFDRVDQTLALLDDANAVAMALKLAPEVRMAILAKDLTLLSGSAQR